MNNTLPPIKNSKNIPIHKYFHINKNLNQIQIKQHSNPTSTTTTSINNPTNNSTNTSNTSTNSLPNSLSKKFKIGSLNTRGLNDETKFKCLLQYIQNHNYTIFGLSETKLKESTKKYSSNKNYTIHWSSNENSQAGVALIINKQLFNHHLKTESFKGYVISSYFTFKPKTTICISQIYIPHDKIQKKLTTDFIKKTIQLNTTNNNPHFIIGDFNSIPNPKIDRLNNTPINRNPIYNHLNNYSDVFRTLNPTKIDFTFQGPTQKSRIDQIWSSNNIISHSKKILHIETNLEFRSDHKIISTTFNPFYLTNKNSRNTKPKFIKYLPQNLNPEDWLNLTNEIDTSLQKIITQSFNNNSPQTHNPLTNPQNLWNEFQSITNNIILPKIPQKKITLNHQNIFNKNGTLLHKQLNLINNTIKKIKKK
jgi:Endonuclease/Exonuclease/phosphatase family